MERYTRSLNKHKVTENSIQQVKGHQILYYNTGEVTVTVNDIPVFPKSTFSEIDNNGVIVLYKESVLIKFLDTADETAIKELMIIEKKYYKP